jgi:hypothetical protein
MSSLGIRFVLPYKGSNGIKVTNNVIAIDDNMDTPIIMSMIYLKPKISNNAIRIDTNSFDNRNAIFIVDLESNNSIYINAMCRLLMMDSSDISTCSFAIFIAPNGTVVCQNYDGAGTLLSESNLSYDNLVTPRLKTIENNANAPFVTFDNYDTGQLLPVDLVGSYQITFDGSQVKTPSTAF